MAASVPGYRLSDLIGAGASAQVYRARPAAGGAEVAVRVGRVPLSEGAARQRFTRRLKAAQGIAAHPHVVAVRDGGLAEGGLPFVVMDLYLGGSYAERLAADGSVPVAKVLDIGFAVADVLVAAHGEGLCHGDLSPAAILLAPDFSPVLAGFELGTSGAADLTVAGDVHDLGGTLFALLTGRVTVRHNDSPGDATAGGDVTAAGSPGSADLPASPVLSVLRRATDPDPQERYPSAEALRDALAAVRAGRPPGPGRIRARPAPPVPTGDGDLSPGRPAGPFEAGTPSADRPGSAKPVDTRARLRQPALVAVAVAMVATLVAVVLVILLTRTG